MRQAEKGVPCVEGDADLRQQLLILEDENKHLRSISDEYEKLKELYTLSQQEVAEVKAEVR